MVGPSVRQQCWAVPGLPAPLLNRPVPDTSSWTKGSTARAVMPSLGWLHGTAPLAAPGTSQPLSPSAHRLLLARSKLTALRGQVIPVQVISVSQRGFIYPGAYKWCFQEHLCCCCGTAIRLVARPFLPLPVVCERKIVNAFARLQIALSGRQGCLRVSRFVSQFLQKLWRCLLASRLLAVPSSAVSMLLSMATPVFYAPQYAGWESPSPPTEARSLHGVSQCFSCSCPDGLVPWAGCEGGWEHDLGFLSSPTHSSLTLLPMSSLFSQDASSP